MENIIAALKDEAVRRGLGMAAGEFELILSAACNQCCDKSEGGNGSCPPPKLEAALS